jgi:hypothetical protein
MENPMDDGGEANEPRVTVVERVLAVREGGHVERCHTTPKHGGYDVAQHSYGALSLLLLLHPRPSNTLIKAILWHDVPERWTGDIPKPAKWASPALNDAEKILEAELLAHLGLLGILTEDDMAWLHAVDMLDFWIWTQEQAHLGNRNVEDLKTKVDDYWTLVYHKLPEPVKQFIADFKFKRLPDCDQLLNRSFV